VRCAPGAIPPMTTQFPRCLARTGARFSRARAMGFREPYASLATRGFFNIASICGPPRPPGAEPRFRGRPPFLSHHFEAATLRGPAPYRRTVFAPQSKHDDRALQVQMGILPDRVATQRGHSCC
jgi:hypothetical protein